VLRERLKGAIWSDDLEVVAKRRALLQRALAADLLLGGVIPHMLAMHLRDPPSGHHVRFSAAQIVFLLESPSRPQVNAAQASTKPAYFTLFWIKLPSMEQCACLPCAESATHGVNAKYEKWGGIQKTFGFDVACLKFGGYETKRF